MSGVIIGGSDQSPVVVEISGSSPDVVEISGSSPDVVEISIPTPARYGADLAAIGALTGAGYAKRISDGVWELNSGTGAGTTQTSFQIDSGNTGPRFKNTSGVVVVRNAGDSANADLTAANVIITGNLTVSGSTTSVNVETVTVDDNIIVLNNNVTSGSPTEDGGIQIRRGASTSASLIWDETNDNWKSGLVGSELRLPQHVVATFTNASLTTGSYAFTHSLGNQYPLLRIVDNNGKYIFPDDVTCTSTTVATFDLTSYGTLTGTWRAVAVG